MVLAVKIGVLALLYAGFARLGLELHAVGGFASLVWPPTGLALAVLLLQGNRLWPGVWIGALAISLWAGASPLVAAAMATGNTLEAVLGAWALRRVPGFHPGLERPRDVLALAVLAALAASAVSATIGVGSLYAAGALGGTEVLHTWHTWWLGDAIGALVVAPLLMTLAVSRAAPRASNGEAALLLAGLVAGSLFIFGVDMGGGDAVVQQPYLLFPLLLWAAVRFGPRGAATAVFLVGAFAVSMTTSDRGPFAHADLTVGLMTMQVFIAFSALTFLVVAALASRAERARAAAEAARAVAEQASLGKTHFLNLLSHELRTPLTALLLTSEQLNAQAEPRQRRAATRMVTQSRRLVELVDTVLEHVHIESGRLTLSAEPFDPAELASACVDEVRPQAEAKQLDLILHAPAAAPFVSDPRLVRLILINLVGNAVKFTAAGKVTVAVARQQDRLRLEVADTGPGIPAAEIDRLFRPFEQLDPLHRKHFAGVGLGLALVAEMTQLLGGTVAVESTVGSGSTFRVDLAASTPAS